MRVITKVRADHIEVGTELLVWDEIARQQRVVELRDRQPHPVHDGYWEFTTKAGKFPVGLFTPVLCLMAEPEEVTA